MKNTMIKVCDRIGDFIVLNLCWILCSIPLFTIGASTTALFTEMSKIVNNEEGYLFRDFFCAFKKNLKKSTAIWLIFIAFTALWYIDFRIIRNNMEQFGTIRLIISCVVEVMIIEVLIYALLLQARYENTVLNTVKNAVFLVFGYLPYTILIACIVIVPILFTLWSFYTMYIGCILWILVGVSCVGWGESFIFSKICRTIAARTRNCI